MNSRIQLLVVVVLTCAVCAVVPRVSGAMEGVHMVGDKTGWVPNFNYSEWANSSRFYKDEWIGFRYDKTMYDVAEVNATDYEKCLTDHPIGYWNKSVTYLQLNHTKRYYFICTKGFCYNGMKLSILVEKKPLPALAPVSHNGASSIPCASKTFWMAIVFSAVYSMIFRF